MSPLAVITAIIFGSAVAIEFGLCTVWFLAWWLRGQSQQLASEVTRLPLYCALLLVLSGVGGLALYGIFKQRHWRWFAQAGMWIVVTWVAMVSWRR